MSRIEVFPLVVGIIGLIANLIAISTFIVGLGKQSSSVWDIDDSIYRPLFYFLIIYGWYTISWFLARRAYTSKKTSSADALEDCVASNVTGVGIAISPIVAAWFITSLRAIEMSTWLAVVAGLFGTVFFELFVGLGLYLSIVLLMGIAYDFSD